MRVKSFRTSTTGTLTLRPDADVDEDFVSFIDDLLSPSRDRTKEWDVDFLAYLKKLEKTKPVIWCGDLNVAHLEIDLANPKANVSSLSSLFSCEHKN